MFKTSLKVFLTCLVSLSLSSCETFQIRNYQFAYKYHPKVGGGVRFGVLDHKFVELTEAEIQELLKTSVLIPPETWVMLSVDIIKACRMLQKKCDSEIAIIDDIFSNLKTINKGVK
jgi:hypothetical protein